MSPALRQLFADPWVWVIAFGLAGLLQLYIKRRITSGVDHQFAVRLEDHRQSLRLTAEAARYDFEQRLAQKNLYSARAHEAAVEVYRACREAHGLCLNLRGFSMDLTFEEFDTKDLIEYMRSHQFPNGKQQEILNLAKNDRDEAMKELRSYLRIMRFQAADKALVEARNVTYLNELYFDDEIVKALNLLFGRLGEWMTFIQFPPETPEERKMRPRKETITEALDELHEIMRDRLRGEPGDLRSK